MLPAIAVGHAEIMASFRVTGKRTTNGGQSWASHQSKCLTHTQTYTGHGCYIQGVRLKGSVAGSRGRSPVASRPPWMVLAACVGHDTNLFFPQPGTHLRSDIREAKKICATCPVKMACLNYALNMEQISPRSCPGIWGGTHERERSRIIHQLSHMDEVPSELLPT